METKKSGWSSQTKIIVIIILLLSLVYVLYKFSVAIAPMVLAIILAYVLNPLVNRLQKKLKMHRVIAILLVYLIMFLLVGTVLMIVIPILIDQVKLVALDINQLLKDASTYFSGQIVFAGVEIDGQALFGRILDSTQGLFESIFGTTIDIVTAVVSSIVWIVFIMVIAFYLINDSTAIAEWFKRLLPPAYKEDVIKLGTEINTIWSAFFRGQLLLALIVSSFITLEGLIIGLPFALLMGVLAGLLEFMPSIGHGIWLVIASLVGLFLGSTWIPIPNWAFMILILVLHTVFTQFDLNYLIPRIIGRSVHLHPLVVIIGIIAGAAIAGVLGVVLAAPTIASLRIILGYIYSHLFDIGQVNSNSVSDKLPAPNIRWWKRKNNRNNIEG